MRAGIFRRKLRPTLRHCAGPHLRHHASHVLLHETPHRECGVHGAWVRKRGGLCALVSRAACVRLIAACRRPRPGGSATAVLLPVYRQSREIVGLATKICLPVLSFKATLWPPNFVGAPDVDGVYPHAGLGFAAPSDYRKLRAKDQDWP